MSRGLKQRLEKRFQLLNPCCYLCSKAWMGCYGTTAKKWTKCPSGCRAANPERETFAENVAMFKQAISAYDRLNHRLRKSDKTVRKELEKELETIADMVDMQDKICHGMIDNVKGTEEKIYRKIFRLEYRKLVTALKALRK